MNMLHSFGGCDGDTELKERLIANVKKEVKQLMEEAVTKRYVHEESSSVTSLCSAVEACLSHGLRRRALGLFKTSSTTALIQKIAKNCPEADYISRRLLDFEIATESCMVAGKRSCSSSDSIIKPKLLNKGFSSNSVTTINTVSSSSSSQPPVNNASNYYDRDALVSDTDYGSILSSLLVGPCALEFTKAKTIDHYWSDPPADELIQRHRISSGNRTPPTCHRPLINFKRSLHTSSEDTSSGSYKPSSPANVAKDYVESLHQNSRATLLYGKNNVLVLPKDLNEPIPGYLSLHQNIQSLTIKWTPNQLMNGYNDSDAKDLNTYWAYAVNINIDEVVYVHCHQNRGDDTGGIIILVGQDGVQRPPIHFPEGGHMQAFLSCLETGLLPHGQLDPPLWSQRGIGKMFPWTKSVRRRILPSVMETTVETPIDYVFRVVGKSQHEEFVAIHSILELGRTSPRRKHLSSCSTTGSSDCSSKSLSMEQSVTDTPLIHISQTTSIELVCSTMRRQIISRAFYGWLAYCRHLSTVRTHLSGLVNGLITPNLAANENGLNRDKWESMHENGIINNQDEIYRLVYFGGVTHELRQEVWPYLLGHYNFGTTIEERTKLTDNTKHYYETTMSEWLAVEAIVRQHEKEKNAKALAKISLENNCNNSSNKFICQSTETQNYNNELDNDPFDDHDYSDFSDTGIEFDDDIINDFGCCKEKLEKKEKEEEETLRTEFKDEYNNEKIVEIDAINNKMQEDYDEIKKEVEQSSLTKVDNVESSSQKVLLDFENIDYVESSLVLQDNCFAESEPEMVRTPDQSGLLLLSIKSSPSTSSYETVGNEFVDAINNAINAEAEEISQDDDDDDDDDDAEDVHEDNNRKYHSVDDVRYNNEDSNEKATHAVIVTQAASNDALECTTDEPTEDTSRKISLISPMNEDITVCEFLENFALNLHRIEKDVQRCDRNYWYFANENLDKLRNVITTYVWKHLEVGYMQGMCDLVAPLLVIFDDEALTYGCFCKLMQRMIENFPNGDAMDMHFANMRSLIQILDSEMYDLMDSNGDYTHFYFCYRWFLLDFKRELVYDDVFATWEVIWAAKHVASSHFVLFLALALLETYRDIILSNSMDFTDVIKFFNEMAERHNTVSILQLARSLVLQLQTIIENK
uniref:Rab-GAP TBC domain-containing protein n=1 Tax=Glossina brevipalpis TaxID=37001 RepID=A0A1A9WDB8_9MUSC